MMALSFRPVIRNAILRLALAAGLDRRLSNSRAGKLVILCYHGIRSPDSRLLPSANQRHLPVVIFEAQLQWLKSRGYSFVTLTEALSHWAAGRPLPDKAACLTFDDGHENIVTNAYPVMKRYDARGCVYVVAGLPGSGRFLWTDVVEMALWLSQGQPFVLDEKRAWLLDSEAQMIQASDAIKAYLRSIPDRERLRQMNRFETIVRGQELDPAWRKELKPADWDQLASLDPEILEVGSHTVFHPNLDRVAEQDLEGEVLASRQRMEQNIGRPVRHFCYPCGAFTPTVQSHVQEAGYLTATSTLPGLNDAGTDRFALRRYMIYSDMTLFRGQVTGVHGFLFGRSM